jgi:hypothetical protein
MKPGPRTVVARRNSDTIRQRAFNAVRVAQYLRDGRPKFVRAAKTFRASPSFADALEELTSLELKAIEVLQGAALAAPVNEVLKATYRPFAGVRLPPRSTWTPAFAERVKAIQSRQRARHRSLARLRGNERQAADEHRRKMAALLGGTRSFARFTLLCEELHSIGLTDQQIGELEAELYLVDTAESERERQRISARRRRRW